MEDYLNYVGGVAGAAVLTGAAAVATTAYIKSQPKSIDVAPFSLNQQAKTLPGPEGIRVSTLCKDDQLLEYFYDDVRTVFDVMKSGLEKSNNGNCLGFRRDENAPYEYIPYSEVIQRYQNFASGLVNIGLIQGQETYLGLYAHNSVEWIITEQACYYNSAILVPLYDTLGPLSCTFIINQASITTVICDHTNKIEALLAEFPSTPNLLNIIATCSVPEALAKRAEEMKLNLYTFADIIKKGEENPSDPLPPKPEDTATVCYTSGTTGNPKGVVLTHKNIMTDVSAILFQLGKHGPTKEDVMMSFLPLAHMLERVCEVATYINGGCVGFSSGNIRNLMGDYKALKPTLTPAVPRILTRIHSSVMDAAGKSRIKTWLLKKAIQSKTKELNRLVIRNDGIWDSMVFSRVRNELGGNIRLLVCGSAPLAGDTLNFVRCALGCLVMEGYGQTEGVGPCTLSIVGDPVTEHVGAPLPCCSFKLVDVPEMEYFASDGKGEVCIKGHNVFKGYLKDQEKTEETIDKDGWLHTGDIGCWLPNNSLKIIDRKKNIFKLSQGEYIAPEKIENIYQSSKFVSQIFVHGESLKSCLVAVVVPEKRSLLTWCNSKNIKGTWDELIENKEAKKAIIEDMVTLGKKAGLKSFEQVKNIYISSTQFSIENNLLTPTLKSKRNELKKHFSSHIADMYQFLV